MTELQNNRPADGEKPRGSPLWWIAPLYLAQGLPYGVVQLMAPIYFTAKGASLTAIGASSLLGLPWTIKPLWSPLTDLFGRRKTWVVAALLLLIAAIGLTAVVSELDFGMTDWPAVGRIPSVLLIAAGILFVTAMLSATADISEDAFYMDALDKRRQALYVGWRVTAYRVAMICASGPLVYIAGKTNWVVGYGLAAILMSLAAGWSIFVMPSPRQSRPTYDSVAGFFGEFTRAFYSYAQRSGPVRLLSFILLFKLGEQMLAKMSTPFFMNACGVTTAQMGVISGTLGVGASIIGAVAGSYWVSRKGIGSSLVPIAFVMGATNLLYVWLAMIGKPSLYLIGAVHMVEHFSGGMGSAAFAFFLIRTCKDEFKASHYAIATGLMSLGGTLASTVGGAVAEKIGFLDYFVICTVAAIPGFVLIFFLPKDLTTDDK